jgi:hypothetical protein
MSKLDEGMLKHMRAFLSSFTSTERQRSKKMRFGDAIPGKMYHDNHGRTKKQLVAYKKKSQAVPPRQMEESEELNEVSKELLKRYLKKNPYKNYDKTGKVTHKVKDKRTATNRFHGWSRALERGVNESEDLLEVSLGRRIKNALGIGVKKRMNKLGDQYDKRDKRHQDTAEHLRAKVAAAPEGSREKISTSWDAAHHSLQSINAWADSTLYKHFHSMPSRHKNFMRNPKNRKEVKHFGLPDTKPLRQSEHGPTIPTYVDKKTGKVGVDPHTHNVFGEPYKKAGASIDRFRNTMNSTFDKLNAHLDQRIAAKKAGTPKPNNDWKKTAARVAKKSRASKAKGKKK